MDFNLSNTIGQFVGKTAAATMLSLRHPIKFLPRNLGQIFKDISSGFVSGLESFDHQIIQLKRVPTYEHKAETTNSSS